LFYPNTGHQHALLKENRDMKVIPYKDSGAVAEATDAIRKGAIAAFPTETFYGLGARYDNLIALKRLYDLKRRPKDKAMPVIIGNREALDLIATPPGDIAERIMEMFWPGPLTILLKARKGLSEFLTAETGKVAVRIPGRSFALELCRSLGIPSTATSANISGMPPACDPGDVIKYFGEGIDVLIDGGRTPGEKPSTIIDVTEERVAVLRQGAIPEEEIRKALFLIDHRL
jgi:L-threonylcarbamoyladenylate synthase